MTPEALIAMFDQQAASYDVQWAKLVAFRDALHLLIGSAFSELKADARVLCVGAGTGAEMVYLAKRFPGWTFSAVEPSQRMLDACRSAAEDHGFLDRCTFHEGFLESLPQSAPFDAATCLLVSQFLLEPSVRSEHFAAIARRLKPGGILASSDLSSDLGSQAYRSLLDVWFRVMVGTGTPEGLERMRAMYGRDVSVLPAREIEQIIEAGGFDRPVQFYQVGLIRAWLATTTIR